MMFPDCRNDENYNEDFLNSKDKEFVRGFDWAAEMAADNLFDNLDSVIEDDYILRRLNEKLPDVDQTEYEFTSTFNETDETRTIKTVADYLRYKLLEYIEMERDELITSMIDNMDEEEYMNIRKSVLEKNRNLEKPKEYYNTRKFAITGKKESSEE